MSKKTEDVVSNSMPSDSDNEIDNGGSSLSSSEGESSDKVFPRDVRGQVMSIIQPTYGDVLESEGELEGPFEYSDKAA